MSEPIYIRTWGEFACFTRPEMKVERVSYPVMTPSAARGLLEAILYKPQFRWCVHRIAVKKPIRFLALRRNEVKCRIPTRNPKPIFAEDERTQRNTLALRDVEYVIEASMELTPIIKPVHCKSPQENEPKGDNNLGKYYGMFRRRAEGGQCFARPCFGCREFAAHFELAEEVAMQVSPEINPDTDLGLLLFDVFDLDVVCEPGRVKAMPKITFFRAGLQKGVLVGKVPDPTDALGVDWTSHKSLPKWPDLKKQLGGDS